MQRFIRHIIFFALPVVIGAIVIECVVERIPNSYTYKQAYMEQHAADIHTLILGSSHAYDGLAPTEMPKAFNLANSSQTLEDDYWLLVRHIEDMDSLQTVVLGVGYSSLSMLTNDNRRLYYTIYMDLYPRFPISKYSFEVFNLELLSKKLVKQIISRDVVRCDSLGQRLGHDAAAVAQQTEFWNKDIAAMVANDSIDVDAMRDVIAYNMQWLDSLSALCAAHQVPMVLVNMPAMGEYIAALPAGQVALCEAVFSSVDDAIYIDASRWSVPADGWYNATHLTREVSVAFTRMVNDSLMSIISTNAQY